MMIVSTEEIPTGLGEHAAVVDELSVQLLDAGRPLVKGFIVTPSHWRAFHCAPFCDCAEHDPQPLGAVQDSALNAALVYAGLTAPEAVSIPEWKPGTLTGIAGSRPPRPAAEAGQAWAELLDGGTVQDTALADSITDLQDADARDWIMARTLTDDTAEIGQAVVGELTHRPNWDRVDAATRILTEALPQIAPNFRPNVLLTLGWIEWLKGCGSRAVAWFSAAQDIEPGHRLAGMLLELVKAGRLPTVALTEGLAYPGLKAS